MPGDTFNTRFLYTASGLPAILAEFKSAAAQINAQSASLGKVSFVGLNEAIPILSRIEAEIRTIGASLNTLSSAGAKAGASLNPLSASATKAAATVKTVGSSMTQLASVSSTVSSAAGRVGSSFSAMGAAGKSAFSGIISGAEAAVASLGAVAAATTAVGRTMLRMGVLASLPMAGLKSLSGVVTGSLLAGSASMLLNPVNIGSVAYGYGLYKSAGFERQARLAAVRQGYVSTRSYPEEGINPATQKSYTGTELRDAVNAQVKQLATDLALSSPSAYGPTDIIKSINEAAALGIDPRTMTKQMVDSWLNLSRVAEMETSTAASTIYAQVAAREGLEGLTGQNFAKYSDYLATLSNISPLRGEDLTAALKKSTPVAQAYGQSVESQYATAAALSSLGYRPEESDAAYRRMLLRFTPGWSNLQQQEADLEGTNLTAGGKEKQLSSMNAALKGIGLTWQELMPGGQLDLLDVAKTLNTKLSGVSDIERKSFLKTISGIQGIGPLLALMQNPELLDKLVGKFNNVGGSAADSAKYISDDLTGAFQKLNAAVGVGAIKIGDYFTPSVRKLTDFVRNTAVPGLEALAGAVISGDWKTAADIVGGALGTVKDYFADSGEGVTEFINSGIAGLDELSARFAAWTSAGGQTSLLEGVSKWAQSIWDGINWDKVDNIVNNLTTAFNSAWDQSMVWLQGKIDTTDFTTLGTRAGEALETAGEWLLKNVASWPWASVTTAATNALTGIIATIDWTSAITGAANVGSDIGKAIYNGLSASNLGTLFQTWALDFQGYMSAAIANVAAALAGLAVQMGVPLASVEATATKVANMASGAKDAVVKSIDEARDTKNIVPILTKTAEGLAANKGNYFNANYNTPGSENTSLWSIPGNVDRFKNFFAGSSWNQQTGEKNGSWIGEAAQTLENSLRVATPGLSFLYDWATGGTQGPQATVWTPVTTPSVPSAGGSQITPPTTPAITTPISSGKFDAITGMEIPKGTPLWQSSLDKSKYVGQEGFKQLDASSKPNFANVGVAGETFSRTSTQQAKDLISSLRTSGVLKEMYGGEKASNFIGYGVGDLKDTTLQDLHTLISSSMAETYVPGKGYVGKETPGTPLITKAENVVRSAVGLSPSSGGGSDKDLAGLAAKNAATDAQNVKNTESSVLSLDQINSGIKNLGDKDIVSLSGVNAKGEPYQKEFYKADINAAAKELIGKGYKLTDVSTQKGQESPISLASIPAATAATKDSVEASKDSASASKDQTTAITGLTGALKDFEPLINASDYAGISKLVKERYGKDNPATIEDERDRLKSAKDWETADQRTEGKSDLIASLDAYLKSLGVFPQPDYPAIKKATEKTADNTSKWKESTSLLDRILGESQKNSEAFLSTAFDGINNAAAQVAATAGTGTGMGTGTGSSYGGAVRIGLDENGRETAVIGSVRQRSWEEEGKTWATTFSEAARNAMSVGNAILPVSADTTQADASLTELNNKATQPTKSTHWIYADNSAVTQAKMLNAQSTWSQHTIYINQVYKNAIASVNYGDTIPSTLPKLQGTPNMPLSSIPAFAEGGYTGSYAGNATVHPHEVILNAAQQNNVAGAMSGAGRTIQISIDARGAIITDGGMDTLVAKIKSALADDAYS